jgi:hypothetical protein
MSRLEGCLYSLKADPSARADYQDCRHGVMLPLGSAWLTVMCDVGNRTARWAGGLKRVRPCAARLTWLQKGVSRLKNPAGCLE